MNPLMTQFEMYGRFRVSVSHSRKILNVQIEEPELTKEEAELLLFAIEQSLPYLQGESS